jgi:hypothetical protein
VYPIVVGLFQIVTKVCRDIGHFMSITGVNVTGNKLFTGVNDTGAKLMPVSLLPAINLSPGLTSPAMKQLKITDCLPLKANINQKISIRW